MRRVQEAEHRSELVWAEDCLARQIGVDGVGERVLKFGLGDGDAELPGRGGWLCYPSVWIVGVQADRREPGLADLLGNTIHKNRVNPVVANEPHTFDTAHPIAAGELNVTADLEQWFGPDSLRDGPEVVEPGAGLKEKLGTRGGVLGRLRSWTGRVAVHAGKDIPPPDGAK